MGGKRGGYAREREDEEKEEKTKRADGDEGGVVPEKEKKSEKEGVNCE